MNAPMIVVLVIATIALIVCLVSRSKFILVAGLFTVWLCICYMLLIPFTSAMRIAVMPIDGGSPAYPVVVSALVTLLNEVVPARLATAFLSFALVLVAIVKLRRLPPQ